MSGGETTKKDKAHGGSPNHDYHVARQQGGPRTMPRRDPRDIHYFPYKALFGTRVFVRISGDNPH
jgi:hypothetical protein